jgi:agmatine deiminase
MPASPRVSSIVAELSRDAARAAESPRALGFRMPAEWEPHAATWLAWPHEARDFPGKLPAVYWVFCEIARQLASGERIRLIVRDSAMERAAARALESSGVELTAVDFVRADTNRSWTRDFVPTFVTRRSRRELAAVKFRFNGWARYKNHAKDEAAGRSVARRLGVRGFEPAFGARAERVVLEGGAIDVDGQGTLLATEACLLDGAQARNPRFGREGIEAALRENLAIDRVLWIGRGVAGDDTGGHIDDFARFVSPGTVVLAEEKRRSDPNRRVLESARERLERARDARGRKIDVIRLPMPEPVYFDGQRLPASYANFYFGNAAVLVPTFNDRNDARALGILSELIRDRPVIGVHARDLVLGLGTIHCSTQQEPASINARLNGAGRSSRRPGK